MKKSIITEKYDEFLKKFGLEKIDKSNVFINVYQKNEYIFYENERLDYLYILVEGTAKCFSSSETGKNLLYDFFKSYRFLGEIEFLLDKKISTTNVMAFTNNVECIAIPLDLYKNWLLNNNAFLQRLAVELAEKLKMRDIISKITILYSLETKLCAYILFLQKDGIFKPNLTELSELFGVTYRHLLRTLSLLIDEEILVKEKNCYIIKSFEKLKEKSCGILGDINL